jgi:hypothetical protein
MTPRRRLNQMRFCTCRHGQSAHRNGEGPCFGERMIGGAWFSCACNAFDPEPEVDDQHDPAAPVPTDTEEGTIPG